MEEDIQKNINAQEDSKQNVQKDAKGLFESIKILFIIMVIRR